MYFINVEDDYGSKGIVNIHTIEAINEENSYDGDFIRINMSHSEIMFRFKTKEARRKAYSSICAEISQFIYG